MELPYTTGQNITALPASLITLREAQQLLAASGKSADVNTLIRWIRKGLGKGDRRVKLQARMLGQWFTTAAWIEDFVNRRTATALHVAPDLSHIAIEAVRENEEAKRQMALIRAEHRKRGETIALYQERQEKAIEEFTRRRKPNEL